jgi:hypothetical protein
MQSNIFFKGKHISVTKYIIIAVNIIAYKITYNITIIYFLKTYIF